jgi:CYTH domain-containing protein
VRAALTGVIAYNTNTALAAGEALAWRHLVAGADYRGILADARALLKLCGRFRLEKVRARIGPWEVDRYTGRHAGLWLAEIELPRADTPLPRPRPPWLSREVTADPRYTNSRLARLKRWPPRWHRVDLTP